MDKSTLPCHKPFPADFNSFYGMRDASCVYCELPVQMMKISWWRSEWRHVNDSPDCACEGN